MADQPDFFGAPVPVQGERVITFGKYKQQPYEILLRDTEYALWLLQSMYTKLQSQHPGLFAFLIARFGQPEVTPEHNSLQNRFLDDDFCRQFALAALPGVHDALAKQGKVDLLSKWTARVQEKIDQFKEALDRSDSWFSADFSRDAESIRKQTKSLGLHLYSGTLEGSVWREPFTVYGKVFEDKGIDVRFALYCHATYGHEKDQDPSPIGSSHEFKIEVKPLMGDDYPVVLRAMKAVEATHLLVDQYVGSGATWDEVAKVFKMSKIEVLLLRDVEAIELPPAVKSLELVIPTQAEATEKIESMLAPILQLAEAARAERKPL